VKPPFTSIAVPVMKPACGPARKTMTAATSSSPANQDGVGIHDDRRQFAFRSLGHIGVHHSGLHDVDGDPARSEIARSALAVAHDRRLAGRVVCRAGKRDPAAEP
jgi:hypothetical protein